MQVPNRTLLSTTGRSLLIDVFNQYLLGYSLAARATESLVAEPVLQALEANSGQGLRLFMLQDNGKQYIYLKGMENSSLPTILCSDAFRHANLSITALPSVEARSSKMSFILSGNVENETARIKKKVFWSGHG